MIFLKVILNDMMAARSRIASPSGYQQLPDWVTQTVGRYRGVLSVLCCAVLFECVRDCIVFCDRV